VRWLALRLINLRDAQGMAKSLGLPAAQVHDLEGLTKQLTNAMAQRGPYLIDVAM
jgi:acetolactate synthase I/II/III large subunit